MDAPHGQLTGVQTIVPAPTPTVSFKTHVFGYQSKDPELGQYANLLSPFLIDVINAGNNLGPAIIRSQIAAKEEILDPLGLEILRNGVAKVYLCPQKLDQPLGQPHNVRYHRFYVFDGNLLDKATYHAIIPNDCFNLIPNNILVPTIPAITFALGGDCDLI